jgi:hypothetical protein
LADSLCLHDAKFLGFGVTFVPTNNGKLAVMMLREGEMQVFLFYWLLKDPKFEEVKSWPFSTNAVTWLYDEFDAQPGGEQQHEVFLSNGQIITLSFYELWLSRAALPEIGSDKNRSSSLRLPMRGSRKQSRRSR